MSTAAHRCPRCKSAFPGPVAVGVELTCDSCGHRWNPQASSDEYLPIEDGPPSSAALTQRRMTPAKTPSSPGEGLPFDQLEREARGAGGTTPRPVSDLAFRPSTDNLDSERCNCPVCGHGFAVKKGEDEQRCPACGTSFVRSTGRLSPGSAAGGDRLIGRVLRGCQIDRKLGEGGMGSVYHARQLSLDRSVAIKVLPPELARNRNFIQRFEREAKSLARINHANILQIYDFGEDVQLGVYFMVIEYVDGWDLGEVLRRQPTLSQIETLDIVRQALLGLEQAAEKGVIHRDIKPDNLMVATSGLCKVSDFGLAKGHGSDSEVTSVGVRVGTPAFMSPEQCDGVEVDSRSDVYNLGCTAYLMLTGRLPFDGETPFSIMLKHKVDPVPSLLTHRTDISPETDGLIRRMMAKKPDDRCYELRELIDETEQLLVSLTGTASVLRKTNGPIRALAQQPPGQGSSGRRAPAAPSEVSPPAPRAKSSGRQRTVAGEAAASPPGQVPEWLRPVDAPAPSAPFPTPPTSPPPQAPAVGSRTAPAPAIGSRTGPMPALGRSAPPPTLATPFPGLATPLPSERRSGSSSSNVAGSAIDRVRERGIKAEIASIAAGAERLADNGHWDQAASEWRRAAQLARDGNEGRRLAELAADAQRRARRRRRMHALVITAVSLALLGVNLWIWPPVVHNLLAERERARLEAIPDHAERARRLREFSAANQGGWAWYRQLFRAGYEVPAAASASIAAEAPPPTVLPRRPAPEKSPAPRPPTPGALTELVRLSDDPTVPFARVVEVARPLAGDREAAAILARSEAGLAEATAARTRLDTAIREGRHGEALDLAARLPTEHPRAGDLLRGLPRPGRVRALDADSAAPVSGLRLSIDGRELDAPDGRFCRPAEGGLTLGVAAPGYTTLPLPVPPGEDGELVVEARLLPAPLWRLAAPTVRPTWVRLHAAGTAAIVLTQDGVRALDPKDGRATLLTLPGMQVTPWWRPEAGGWSFAVSDGEVRQVMPTLDRTVPISRLGGAPLALLDIDLVYRAGNRLTLAIEAVPDGRVLVARDGPREAWRVTGLGGTTEPLLRRADDKVVAIDDLHVRVLDEDGSETARLALAASRTGPWAELPGGRLLLATTIGVQLIQLGQGGARLVPQEWLSKVGPAVPAAAGPDMVLASQTERTVFIADWAGEQPKARWRAKVSGRPVLASITDGMAAIADENGGITVLRLADGVTLRRVAHGAAPASAPLLLGNMLIVADQTGAVAGYRLP